MFKQLRCWWRGYHQEQVERDDSLGYWVATGKCPCGARRAWRPIGNLMPGAVVDMWWPYGSE